MAEVNSFVAAEAEQLHTHVPLLIAHLAACLLQQFMQLTMLLVSRSLPRWQAGWQCDYNSDFKLQKMEMVSGIPPKKVDGIRLNMEERSGTMWADDPEHVGYQKSEVPKADRYFGHPSPLYPVIFYGSEA